MELYNRKRVHTALTATLLVILSIVAKCCEATDSSQTKAEINTDPSHLSWTSDYTRFDFVFNIHGPIKRLVKLESDPANFLTNSLKQCTDHSACLFRNGTYLESFQVNNTNVHKSIFTSIHQQASPAAATATNPSSKCDNGNKFEISHYCSTNWNPPNYLGRLDCKHRLEWHSPVTCHTNSTNQEHPCYIYTPAGKLVDLTHWILSNGTSYQVDIGNSTLVKKFNVNVCNEAHESCGPNVSACYIDDQLGTIESGYNNLTSIKYDAKDQAVLLTSLGHYNPQCEDSRLKTVIRFTCKNKIIPQTGPKLIRFTACESIIEWPTVHACPTSEVQAPATNCRIKYEPLGIDIDLKKLTNNQTMVEVPDIVVNGAAKKMLLGICQAIPKSVLCEGKFNSNTKACLLDAHSNLTANTANNSQIVGSVTKSTIRLSDDRIYLESFAVNKTCSEPVRPDFNVTRKIGTRIEFFCSDTEQAKPKFLDYDDCTYIFEWGSPEMCLEKVAKKVETATDVLITPSSKNVEVKDGSKTTGVKEPKKNIDSKEAKKDVNIKDAMKNVNIEQVMKNVNHKVIKKAESPKADIEHLNSPGPPKMNSAHKFFMISLIFMSFAAFIVIIFVLDKKTRLRITLRQARQAFQSNSQQPYSRVVSDLDL